MPTVGCRLRDLLWRCFLICLTADVGGTVYRIKQARSVFQQSQSTTLFGGTVGANEARRTEGFVTCDAEKIALGIYTLLTTTTEKRFSCWEIELK
jgi:hypothetical protein